MNSIKLVLEKDNTGITAANETTSVIEHFDESDEQRKEFVKLMVEFMNAEVDNGAKYK